MIANHDAILCLIINSNAYPIHFNMTVDLASFVQCEFFCIILLVYVVLSATLLEFLWLRIPALFPISINDILAGVAAVCVIQLGSIAIATIRFLRSCRGSLNQLQMSEKSISRVKKLLTFSIFLVDTEISSFLASSIGLPLRSTRLL